MTTLQQRILAESQQALNARPSAWLVWCDPRGEWAPLLRATLHSAGIPLIEVETRTAGKLGGPVDRARLQAHIDTGAHFVLRAAAQPEDLGGSGAGAPRREDLQPHAARPAHRVGLAPAVAPYH